MDNENIQKVRVEHHHIWGLLWIACRLFTIGFLHLTAGRGVLAILSWPYYIGTHLAPWRIERACLVAKSRPTTGG